MSETTAGSATVVTRPSIAMAADGKCLTETLLNLQHGYGSKPMSSASISKARQDALALLEEVLKAYDADVATGEVGTDGSCRAASVAPKSGHCPTGLLYGRVQSGKTVAMITFTAAALDNGFRVVVVLTSDNLMLVEQTADRFRALHGPLVKHSNGMDTWEPDVAHVSKQISEHGLVLVCAKNQSHLKTLVGFLEKTRAEGYPALILDDEADQATLDTTTAARSAQNPSAPQFASTINRRTVRNEAPWEEGESIRERLPHHVFLQVTATPYALLLQNYESESRPRFTRLLEPGDGYTGGESFFSAKHVEGGGKVPPLVCVDPNESQLIDGGVTEAPDGVQKAVCFFLVSAAAQLIQNPSVRGQGQNFLCHTSHKTTEHAQLAKMIREFLSRVGDDLKLEKPTGNTALRLEWAYDELKKTLAEPPTLAALCETIRTRLPRREVLVVNSAMNAPDFGRELNFIIGGNILGRGLTIDNLLVTYYLRRAKVSQMDTVLQHARMFGYRGALMAYTRVFLPESLAFRFHHIHVAEHRLRSLLATVPQGTRVPIGTTGALRATRPNVLDTGSLSAYTPGEQVYPIAPSLEASAQAKSAKIEVALKKVMGGALKSHEYVPTSIDQVVELLKMIPYVEEEAGSWDPDMLTKVLRAISAQFKDRAFVYYRTMERTTLRLTEGAISGDVHKEARSKNAPVLFLLLDSGKKLSGVSYWYPTLVFPEDMVTQVFNVAT